MRQTIPACPKCKPEVSPYHPNAVELTYTIEVITPLFGGGVEAGIKDPVTLIRPSSIRGHLRFWWRATRGVRFKTVEALRQREGEIWGTTTNPSPVGLLVKVTKKDTSKRCARYDKKKNGDRTKRFSLEWESPFDTLKSLPYALFPFQGTAPDSEEPKDPSKFVGSAKFELTVVLIPTQRQMTKLRAEYNKQRKKIGLPMILAQDDDIQPDVKAAVWAWVNFGGIGARTRRGCGALFCQDFTPSSVNSLGDWFESKFEEYGLGGTIPVVQWPLITKPPLIASGTSAPLEAWRRAVSLMWEFRQGSVGRNSFALVAAPQPQGLELKSLENPPDLTSYNMRRPDLASYSLSPLSRSTLGSALEAFIVFAGEKGFREVTT